MTALDMRLVDIERCEKYIWVNKLYCKIYVNRVFPQIYQQFRYSNFAI